MYTAYDHSHPVIESPAFNAAKFLIGIMHGQGAYFGVTVFNNKWAP